MTDVYVYVSANQMEKQLLTLPGLSVCLSVYSVEGSAIHDALLEKSVEPPHKPKIMQVTQTAFISCHKQLLLTLHVNWGNNSIVTSTPII